MEDLQKNNFSKIDSQISKDYQNHFKKSKKPKILICTPEITELPEGMGNAANLFSAKGGGLGDISAGLVKHINENKKYELHIVIPKYDLRVKKISKIANQQINRLAVVLSGRGIHLVNDSAFSYIEDPYSANTLHPPVRRSLAYQRYVINELLDNIKPDVVHCNDWMTALIPAAAKSKGIKSLFTLHNIFSEYRTMKEIEISGIRPIDFMENLYFESFPGDIKKNWKRNFETNRVDFTASAILASDYFNTVSPSFLEELYKDEFRDLVTRPIYNTIKEKYEKKRAVGILNAPNDTINPKVMAGIINFNKYTMKEKKAENKKLFQEKLNLPIEANIPLFFWPNRLYAQKGPDILIDNLEYFFSKYKMQIAFVANGDKLLEAELKKLQKKYHNLSFKNFDENLSNLGKAGADFILMPSRYEPCGLPQMEALRFGTLPIVRATGGLKDSISHLDVEKNTGNGFVFLMADKAGLEFGIKEALNFYQLDIDIRIKQMQRIMSESKRKYNLKTTAEKYMEIYDKLIKEKLDER